MFPHGKTLFAGGVFVYGLFNGNRRDTYKECMMNSAPTNQQLADTLGITADEVRTYIVRARSLAMEGGWVLTFSPRTPEQILSQLNLTQSLTCTVVLRLVSWRH
jgi:hypothetical protein